MTVYTTSGGYTRHPVHVELWTPLGERLGYVGDYHSMHFTWSDRGPDTAVLSLPLTDTNASLLPVDGSILVGARVGNKTHLSTPVEVKVEGDEQGQPVLQVTTAGGWALFSGARIPPSLEDPLVQQTGEEYQLSGGLDTVVKRLVRLAAARLDLPVLVAPDNGGGPTVEVSGAWETVGEVLEKVLTASGFHLEVVSWLPGDPAPHWATSLSRPCVLVDLVPYRDRPGLAWSVEGGDLSRWELRSTRATATRVTVGYKTDTQELRQYITMARNDTSAWGRREDYVSYEYKTPEWGDGEATPDPYRVQEGMDQAGDHALTEAAPDLTLDMEVEVANLWTFSNDRLATRTFDVGDTAQVSLPYLGTFTRTITAVEVKVDHEGYSVVPTLSTPDTMDRDMYSAMASLDRRVANLERK